jgi:prepilin-type N-terminal cleavage/methylation domain-containing protein
VVATRRRDDGFSLVEMMFVVALLGTALAAVFGAVNVLAQSASNNMEQSAAARDLAYSMELLSKTITSSMSVKVLYASDYQLVVLAQDASGSWQVNSISATLGVAPGATRGSLVWEKWGSDPTGTTKVGTYHNVWPMSDRNMNRYATPPIPLFTYYSSATDLGLMGAAEKSAAPDTSLSAFLGTLPGGYTATQVGRIRLHVATALNNGVRDDSRDIVLRFRG